MGIEKSIQRFGFFIYPSSQKILTIKTLTLQGVGVEKIKKQIGRGLKRERWPTPLFLPLLFLLFITFTSLSFAQEVDLKIIAKIESAFNPLVYNPKTQAIGLYQITPIVLKEYNQFNKTNYTQKDLINPVINEKIARWYLFVRIPQMLKYYKKEVNLRNILVAYNAGIKAVIKGYLPKETKEYLRKYENFKNNFS